MGLVTSTNPGTRSFVAAVAIAVLTATAVAQDTAAGRKPGAPRETMIGGTPPTDFQRCIDVQIGTDRGFGCINEQLRREVDKVNPSIALPPLDARSPDIRVGNVNEAAVRQQYGINYGRSVYPFRPPPPIFPHR